MASTTDALAKVYRELDDIHNLLRRKFDFDSVTRWGYATLDIDAVPRAWALYTNKVITIIPSERSSLTLYPPTRSTLH